MIKTTFHLIIHEPIYYDFELPQQPEKESKQKFLGKD